MSPDPAPSSVSVHASAVAVGEAGVLIRGASGAGKSSIALALIEMAEARGMFARLVADDRVLLETRHGRVVARPHQAIAGRVERRGQGVSPIGHEPAAVLRCVVDLAGAGEAARMPPPGAEAATIKGVDLPRLVIPAGLPAIEGARILLDYLARSRL